jgi:transcription termination/antitermination protein NusG
MHKWYVIQVLSTHEKKVKKAIEERAVSEKMTQYIEQVVLPVENVSEVKRGQQRVVEKRLWPGYLLIKMELNDDSITFIKNINGIVDFLGGEIPTALEDAEVEKLLQDLESKSMRVVQKHKLQVGDKVKITDGVFVNFIGTVTDLFEDKGRLSCMVSIFGRETRVDDLEFWQVEEVNEETASS